MDDFMIIGFGITAILGTKRLVNIDKLLGLTTKYALLAAIVLGVLLSVLNQLATMFPAFKVWYTVVMTGLAVGLAGAEVYDNRKAMGLEE